MVRILLVLSFSLNLLAFHSLVYANCERDLTDSVSESVRLELAFVELERLGMTQLLAEVHDHGIETEYRTLDFASAPAVEWKAGWVTGRKTLIVRRLPWGNLKERQLSTWNVAVALYQLQLRQRFRLWPNVPTPDLDREMQMLASQMGELSARELDRGNIQNWLLRARRLVIAGLLSAAAATAGNSVWVDQGRIDSEQSSMPSEVLQKRLSEERARLEAKLEKMKVEGAPAADIARVEIELKNLE